MIHLIYISSATSWPTEDELKFLLNQSRSRNAKQNITGLLLYSNATYMQVLEGAKEDVHEIFESIKNDPRNNGVVKLIEEEISERTYPDWLMGFKEIGKDAAHELDGYSDIFLDGKLDKDKAIDKQSISIKLLKGFVKNNT